MIKQATLAVIISFALLNTFSHSNASNDCDMGCCDVAVTTDSFNSDHQCCEMTSLTCSISPGIVQLSKKSNEIYRKIFFVSNQVFRGEMDATFYERKSNSLAIPPPAPPGHMTPLRV